MTRSKQSLVLISALALGIIFTGSGTPSDLETTVAPELVSTTPETARPAPQAKTPLMQAIEATMEEAHLERAALQAQAEATKDPAAYLAIQRKIEQIHHDTELTILELQVEHFRAMGLLDAVEQIQEAIAVMSSSRQGIPEHRPMPNPNSEN